MKLKPINRRYFISAICALTLSLVGKATAGDSAALSVSNAKYKISVCDWMILKRQKLGAFQLAKDIGADGVEVDMGGLGDRPTFDSKLGDAATRQQFLNKAHELGLSVSSIAMSGFYAQSFAERDEIDRVVQDAIDTAKAMNVKVVFLPLGVKGDLVQHPQLRPATIARLRAAGSRAGKAGVVIGIETSLDAKAEASLLEEIGSAAVKSYFNFENAWQNHRDVNAELRALGKDRIASIHASNTDGVWLQNDPQVDLVKIKATLDEMGWTGWLVVERSRDASRARDVKYNFGANVVYLKKVFQ